MHRNNIIQITKYVGFCWNFRWYFHSLKTCIGMNSLTKMFWFFLKISESFLYWQKLRGTMAPNCKNKWCVQDCSIYGKGRQKKTLQKNITILKNKFGFMPKILAWRLSYTIHTKSIMNIERPHGPCWLRESLS